MNIWLILTRWLAGKAVLFLTIVLICILILAAKFFATEWIRSAEARESHWRTVKEQAEETMREMEATKNSLERQVEQRRRELEAARRNLNELNGLWSRLKDIFNLSERKRKQEELREKIRAQEQAQRQIRNDLSSVESERQEANAEFNRAERERQQAEAILNSRKTTVEDARSIITPWIYSGLKTGLVIFLLVLFIPYVYGLLAYYILAPLIKRAPPLIITPRDGHPHLSATESAPAAKIHLHPNQEMVARPEFLQGSQEDLKFSTCWIWKWSYPFTCIVCGLSMLTRVHNSSTNNQTRQITFSHQEDGMLEVAKISVPDGGSIVIRPRFIAGLVHDRDKEPRIRAVWVFTRLHAWVTFQFRYFLIEGPVDVLVAAGRGVQIEPLDENCKYFRGNRNRTIAFSPELGYNSIRTETLIGYLRKKNPLFDDYFTGTGVVYKQQSGSGPNDSNAAEGAWGKFLSGLGKVLGF